MLESGPSDIRLRAGSRPLLRRMDVVLPGQGISVARDPETMGMNILGKTSSSRVVTINRAASGNIQVIGRLTGIIWCKARYYLA